ncbi:MAG: UPF0149 family protein [Methylococcales bacterium]|nr:UPF0149 family protein [Methylococcales bacterium]
MAYQTLSSIFQRYNSELSVAEAHGMATAMLCVDAQSDVNQWMREVFDDDAGLVEEDEWMSRELFEQTRNLLNPEESLFEFDLFLPEHVELSEQATAIINWSQGFLLGIGYSDSQREWQGETQGILRDMVEFTKLDAAIEDDDDDEEAYMQIHEYLRAAVLTIRDELNDDAGKQP